MNAWWTWLKYKLASRGVFVNSTLLTVHDILKFYNLLFLPVETNVNDADLHFRSQREIVQNQISKLVVPRW